MAEPAANRAEILEAVERVMRCDPQGWNFAIVEGSRRASTNPLDNEFQTFFVQWARTDEGLDFEAGDPAYSDNPPHSPDVIARLDELGLEATDINFKREFQFADTEAVTAQEVADLAYEILFNLCAIDPASELNIHVEDA